MEFLQKNPVEKLKKYLSNLRNILSQHKNDFLVFIFDEIDRKITSYRIEIFLLLPIALLLASKRGVIVVAFRSSWADEYLILKRNINRLINELSNLLDVREFVQNRMVSMSDPVVLSNLSFDGCHFLAKSVVVKQLGYNLDDRRILEISKRIYEFSKGHPLTFLTLLNRVLCREPAQRISLGKGSLENFLNIIQSEIEELLIDLRRENRYDIMYFLVLLSLCGGAANIRFIFRLARSLEIRISRAIFLDSRIKFFIKMKNSSVEFSHPLFLEVILQKILPQIEMILPRDQIHIIVRKIWRRRPREALILSLLIEDFDFWFKLLVRIYRATLLDDILSLTNLVELLLNLYRIYTTLISKGLLTLTTHYCKFVNMLAELLLKMGDQETLINILENSVKTYCTPERIPISLWLRMSSRLLPAYNYIGQYSKALEVAENLKKTISTAKEIPPEIWSILAIINYNEGISLDAMGKPDEAIKAYFKASQCLEKVGYSFDYIHFGDKLIPVAKFETARRIPDPIIRFIYLLIHNQVAQYVNRYDRNLGFELKSRFLKTVEKLIEIYPKDLSIIQLLIAAHLRICINYISISDFSKAMYHAQEAAKLAEKYNIRILLGTAYSRLASIHKALNNLEEALKWIDKACDAYVKIRYYQEYLPCALTKIRILMELGRLEDAVKELESEHLKSAIRLVENNKLLAEYNKLVSQLKPWGRENAG